MESRTDTETRTPENDPVLEQLKEFREAFTGLEDACKRAKAFNYWGLNQAVHAVSGDDIFNYDVIMIQDDCEFITSEWKALLPAIDGLIAKLDRV